MLRTYNLSATSLLTACTVNVFSCYVQSALHITCLNEGLDSVLDGLTFLAEG